jgi:hypothetical protein
MMMSNVLGNIHFSRNQPPKTGDETCTGILKNKIENLGTLRCNLTFIDEADTALFKDPVRAAQ